MNESDCHRPARLAHTDRGLARRRLLLAAGLVAAYRSSAAHDLRVLTEELPPYNYTQDRNVTGVSTEVVRAVLAEAGLTGEIQVLPWARAYEYALQKRPGLIYSIARTPQREALFQWIGTLVSSDFYLFAHAARPVHLNRLEQAREFQIATVNEDVAEQFLRARGFELGVNLQSSQRYEANYEKLRRGRVDLWLRDELAAHHIVRRLGDDAARSLVKVLAVPELAGDWYLAASLATPLEWVNRLREAMQRIKSRGQYEQIVQRWR